MSSWIQIFLDLPRPEFDAAVPYWEAATGWEASPVRGEDSQFATLLPPDGPPWVKLQAVDGGPGVHLDLDSDDREAAVRRSLELGATHTWTYADVPVHRSPGGFTFCHTVVDGSPRLVRGADVVLDQVCLDVPPRLWDAEVAFWAALTEREVEPGLRSEYVNLERDGAVRILLQRLDDDGPAVTGHPDFAVADREGETRRHVGLGATEIGRFERWTVLRAPDGLVYCLTDRDPQRGWVRA